MMSGDHEEGMRPPVVQVPLVEISSGQQFAGKLLRRMGMLMIVIGAVRSLFLGGVIHALSGGVSLSSVRVEAVIVLLATGAVVFGALMMGFGAVIGGRVGLRDGRQFGVWLALSVGRTVGVTLATGVGLGVVGAMIQLDLLGFLVCVVVVVLLVRFSVTASLAKARMEERWEAIRTFQSLLHHPGEEEG